MSRPSTTAPSSDQSALDVSDQLRISVGRLWRRIRNERSVGDLGELQFSVLAHVVRIGPLSFTRIAADVHVTPPSITRAADHLVEAGLAHRSRDSRDARVWVLAATPAGEALVTDVHRARAQWLSAALAQLSPSERRTVERAIPLLRRMAEGDATLPAPSAARAEAPLPPSVTAAATAPSPRTGGSR